MQLGQNYSAVPLPADRRVLGAHPQSDVDLTDGRANDARSRFCRDVIDNATGGKVRHNGALAVLQNLLGGESQSVVLTDRHAFIGDERQPIYIGIDGHPDVTMRVLHELLELTEVFSHGLRRPRKPSVGLHVDGRQPAAEQLEEDGHESAASATDTIETDPELLPADAFDVEKRKRQD